MGGLKVHGLAMSTCTTRVAATLEELGVEYEIVPIDFSVAEHKQPPHLIRNPFGQIPALVDGDLTLFESRAISRYVARKFKGGGGDLLREGNPTEAAAVDVWMEVEAQQFGPPASAIFYEIVVAPMYGKKADEDAIARNVEKLGKVLDVYEERLSKSKYLAGDFISLADLHHLPYAFFIAGSQHGNLVADRPHVKAWWEDVSSRPACKKATEGMAAAAAMK